MQSSEDDQGVETRKNLDGRNVRKEVAMFVIKGRRFVDDEARKYRYWEMVQIINKAA